MHPLDGPRLKLRAAEHKTYILQADMDHHARVHNYRVVPEFHSDTGKTTFRARIGAPLDPRCGVSVGEIGHNLRSALDGLIWQLALQTTRWPDRNTQFPIFDHAGTVRHRTGFRGSIKRYLKSLKPLHWTMIEQCQPYSGTNGGLKDSLWLLHQMNNFDKHRALSVIVAIGVQSTVQFSEVEGAAHIQRPRVFHGKPFEDGAVFAEFTAKATKMKVQYEVATQVQFGNGCAAVEKLSVLDVLHAMCRRVDGIIDSFAPEFPAT